MTYKSNGLSISTYKNGTSPYSIELDNDTAVIGTDVNGGGYTTDTLKRISAVKVTVFEGNSDISNDCEYSWSVTGGTLNTEEGRENCFTSLGDNNDATATVAVTKEGTSLGSKEFTISKNKQGESAISYSLSITPNTWSWDTSPAVIPVFSVIKYVGDVSSTAPNDEYQIRKSGESSAWTSGNPISDTTTFELYVKDSNGDFTIKVDSETVDRNGGNAVAKKAYTELARAYPWSKTGSSSNYWSQYVSGYNGNWTIISSSTAANIAKAQKMNNGLNAGDIFYIKGTITDLDNTPIRVYCTLEEILTTSGETPKLKSLSLYHTGESGSTDFYLNASSYTLKKTGSSYDSSTLTLVTDIPGLITWYKDGTVISGKTGKTYTAEAPGTYKAKCGHWEDTVIINEVSDGKDGKNGTDGRGIDSTTIQYAVTNKMVEPSSITDWKTQMPTVSSEQYLWTRTIIDYTTGDDSISYTYSYQGKNGAAGTSVTITSIQYQAGSSATSAPTGNWSSTIPTVGQGKYLWSKTTFSNNEVAYGVSYQSVDGDPAQDFNITANSYVLKKSFPTATTYSNSIVLTAHKINITGDVKWYKGSTSSTVLKTANTYTVTSPGTYYAVCGSWSDSVTISEVADGATAIAIVLTNPTMTFHESTANEEEYCEVIVYEGGEKLTQETSGDGTFSITEKTDSQNKASITNGKIKISDPSSDGSATFTVTVRPKSQATATSQDYTIYWTVVKNGTSASVKYAYKGFTEYQTDLAAPTQTSLSSSTAWTDAIPTYNSSTGANKYIYQSSQTIVGSTYSASGWSPPVLFKLSGNAVTDVERTFQELTNGGTKLGVFNKTTVDENDILAINATYINTGELKVSNSNNEIFYAGLDNGVVRIAGWTATQTSLSKYKGTESTSGGNKYYSNSIGMRVDAVADGNAFAIGNLSSSDWSKANFRVTGDGTMHATGADISGKITADSGMIGGWRITNTILSNFSEAEIEGPNTQYSNKFALKPGAGSDANALAIGKMCWNSWATANFRITGDGIMYAKGANIADDSILGTNLYITSQESNTRLCTENLMDLKFVTDAPSKETAGAIFALSSQGGVINFRAAAYTSYLNASTLCFKRISSTGNNASGTITLDSNIAQGACVKIEPAFEGSSANLSIYSNGVLGNFEGSGKWGFDSNSDLRVLVVGGDIKPYETWENANFWVQADGTVVTKNDFYIGNNTSLKGKINDIIGVVNWIYKQYHSQIPERIPQIP